MGAHLFQHHRRLLARHQPESQLGQGFAGQDRFRAGALEAATEAIDLRRGPRPEALEAGVAGFAEKRGRTGDGEDLRIAKGQPRPGLTLPRFQRHHVVVEAGHGHASVGVVQARHQPRERRRGVRHRAAVDAGVQVGGRAGDAQFQRRDTAQAVGESGHARREHPGVRDGDDIAAQLLAMRGEKLLQMRAADFLLALDEHDEIHGQPAGFAQRLADAHDVGKDLSFVVRRAAGKDDAVFDPRLEGRRLPQLQRIDRLHVVVPVDHHRAPPRHVRIARHHDGMPRRGMDDRVQADRLQPPGQPARARRHVRRVRGIGGNAGETEKGEELFDVVGIHGRRRG